MSSFQSNALTTVIASGQSLSPALAVDGSAVVGIIIPAAVTATFQGSIDGSNFYNIYQDDGTEYSAVCVSGAIQSLDLNQFLAPRFVKIRVGTSGAPSSVSVATTVILVTKEL